MACPAAGVVTELLRSSSDGDIGARERLLSMVYPDLRRIAHSCFRGETRGQTLEPTALVHEAFIRLTEGQTVAFADRVHFFAIAARQMRRVLVDYARRRRSRRDVQVALSSHRRESHQLTPIDIAILLDRLSEIDLRAAEIVELRYWGGLDLKEIAAHYGVSLATVERDWKFARLWLAAEHGRS